MTENFLKTKIDSFNLIKFTIINQHSHFSTKHYHQAIGKKLFNKDSLKCCLKKLDFEFKKKEKVNNSISKVHDWLRRNFELEYNDLFASSGQISPTFKNERFSALSIRKLTRKVKMKNIAVNQRKINMIKRIRREFFLTI
jgi:hypothetical protein